MQKKIKKQMKLRNLILISTILISTTIVFMLAYISNRQFESFLTERMVRDYDETVNILKKNVETLIYYMQDFSKYMSLDESVLEAITNYENMTEETRARNELEIKRQWDMFSNRLIFSTSMIYSLEIYTEDKLVYSYYSDPLNSSQKHIPEEVKQEAFSQSAPVWSDLLMLKQYRSYAKKTEYGFAIVKSVRDAYAKKVGTVAVFVRESSFADILEPVNEGKTDQFYLVSGEDTIISSKEKEKLYQDAPETLELTESEYQQCVEDGMLLKSRTGEIPVLYISRDIGERGIKLVGRASMEELGRQQREITVFISCLVLIAVGLAIVSAWLTSRRVTKPLGELMDVMERIKEGDENSHLRFEEENAGEVGILGHRFNELMDELDVSMQRIYEEQRQRRHNEVRLLQTQIVPHFLYNTMGIISSFIKLGMTEEALTAIQNLVSFYRLSLSSGKEIITLKEEVDLTQNYMELQQLRYIEYMEYTIECDKEAERTWIPKLTIQPLMENVLHHGLKPGRGRCEIRVNITADVSRKRLKICVWDNGAGIEAERLQQLRRSLETGKSVTKSFGIQNINQRLKLMYGESYRMIIDSAAGEYTQFTIELPMDYKYEDEGNV